MTANDLDPIGIRRFVPLYRFFYMDDYNRTYSIKGLLGKNQGGDGAFFYNGFLKLNSYSPEIPAFFEPGAFVPKKAERRDSAISKGRKFLSEISRVCLSLNIKFIIVHPPLPFSMKNNIITSNAIQTQITKSIPDKNYVLLDYAVDSALHRPQYFSDNTHLNLAGSQLFSERLASDLKKLVENNFSADGL